MSSNVCFWLDAHYSEGLTFQDKCPLIYELKIIQDYVYQFDSFVVLIDDIYWYKVSPEDYP